MAPALAAALISAAPAVIQGVTGLVQGAKGRRMEREAGDRPEYQIPQEVIQALELAKNRASQTRLPGQSLMEQGIRSSTASTAGRLEEAAGDSASLLGALAQTGVGEQQSIRDLGLKAAQYQDQTQRDLLSYLNKMGTYRDKEFEMNEMEPWTQAMGAASAMKGAGMQNVFAAGSDLAGVGMNFMGNKALEEILGLAGKSNAANATSIDYSQDIDYDPNINMGSTVESPLNTLGVDYKTDLNNFLDSMSEFNKYKFS